MTQIFFAMLVLVGVSMGGARIVRSLPWAAAWQARLERTWTKGKPLNCWTCLAFWSAAFFGLPLLDLVGFTGYAWSVLGATGIGATVLRLADPMVPLMPMPELEQGDDDADVR